MKTITVATACVLVLGLCLLSFVGQATSQPRASEGVPAIITQGCEVYATDGREAAVNAWASKGPLDGDQAGLQKITDLLGQIEAYYGKYAGFDRIKLVHLAPKSQIAYMTLNYETGPLFCRFALYKSATGWVVTNANFHTEPTQILPPSYLADGVPN
jgi:hypothetical protein